MQLNNRYDSALNYCIWNTLFHKDIKFKNELGDLVTYTIYILINNLRDEILVEEYRTDSIIISKNLKMSDSKHNFIQKEFYNEYNLVSKMIKYKNNKIWKEINFDYYNDNHNIKEKRIHNLEENIIIIEKFNDKGEMNGIIIENNNLVSCKMITCNKN